MMITTMIMCGDNLGMEYRMIKFGFLCSTYICFSYSVACDTARLLYCKVVSSHHRRLDILKSRIICVSVVGWFHMSSAFGLLLGLTGRKHSQVLHIQAENDTRSQTQFCI